MKTYDERLANIRAKADANMKAYRAIAVTIATLSVFALTICAFVFLPIFGGNPTPTNGPALYQPTDTPNTPTNPAPVITHPSDTAFPDEPAIPADPQPSGTIPNIPEPTQPQPTEPEFPMESVLRGNVCIKTFAGPEFAVGPIVIRSTEELTAFCETYDHPDTGFEDVRRQAAKYSDAFFETYSLVLAVKPESSGSNLLSVSDVLYADDDSVRILVDRVVPGKDEVGTCDMAFWYIFAEVLSTDVTAEQVTVEYSAVSREEEMAFSVKTLPVGYEDKYLIPSVTVIRSVEELLVYNTNDYFRDAITEYDAAFFETNTLILLCRYESSSGNVNKVVDVSRDSVGSIRLLVNRWPHGVTCDVAVWCAAVTIPEVLPEETKVKADYKIVYSRPVTYTDLSFTATYDSGPGGLDDALDGKLLIIRSMEELGNEFGTDSVIYRKYEAAFFTQKTLVIYSCNESSGMARHEVTAVRQGDDGRYRILLDSIYPEVCTEDAGSGIVYIEVNAKIPEDAVVGVIRGYRIITNEQWEQRYGDSAAIPPERPGDTNLEFWIGQDVGDVDFSSHTEIYGWFGVREFLGQGYVSKDEPFVSYLIGAFPDESDGGSFVTRIEIYDANVVVYGLTINATSEEFKDIFAAMKYAIIESCGVYQAKKNGITFTFVQGRYMHISAQVTNHNGIIY